MDLELNRQSIWQKIDQESLNNIMIYGEEYKKFLDACKTEREATAYIIEQAKKHGFVALEDAIKNPVKKGDKIFLNNKNKSVLLFVMGEDISEGMKILACHIDSPRLDIKQNPLYEDSELALLKTHYYGGIKKYQWPTIQLALHGYVKTKNGEEINLKIGEEEKDPVFFINDLLPHFSRKQEKTSLGEAIEAEKLNLVVGHSSYGMDELENPIKKSILKILNENYGMVEEDFAVAEFEVVPAAKARDLGFDRSMICAYGQDDRVCAFASIQAIFDIESPETTVAGIFVDKEEIGSTGNTTTGSVFFENAVAELIGSKGNYCELDLKRSLARSKILSADVTAALDPDHKDVADEHNAALLGYGVAVQKYTGSGGKYGASDANAEYLSYIRDIFSEHDIIWQTATMGKVDQGGGGTIALDLAKWGSEVLDCGTAMLSMHGPIEVVSKADAYMTYRAYSAFIN